MFFALSKILDVAFSPLWWALLLTVGAGGLLWTRPASRRAALGLLFAAVAVLTVFSLEPVSNALYRAAEQPIQTTMRPEGTYDVAIVLGGSLSLAATASTGQPDFNDGADRVVAALELWRAGRVHDLLLTGGDPEPQGPPVLEAAVEAQALERWGVPAERITVELESRNTWENAINCAPMVRAHGWRTVLLITSAAHMSRAAGAFRAVGLAFDTLSVDVRAYDPKIRHGHLMPRSESLHQSESALRELAGRVIYRLRGYWRPAGQGGP